MENTNSVFEKVMYWVNEPFLHIGQTPVTLGGIISAIIVFLLFLALSGLIERFLVTRMSKRLKLDSGTSYAIQKILHYAIILTGAALAFQCIGLSFGSLAVIFGFLSVGIGFGLKNIASNFISGIILLFERPISVGDFVTADDDVGHVVQIRMRSTIIRTLDNVSIIVPNSTFVEESVINWSHGDPKVRIHCKVGVAYGSDIPLVKKSLLEVAEVNEEVLKTPEPEARFLGFGDSSLDFDLLVWINQPRKEFLIRSQINYAIDDIFRKNKVTIPFPQRDLHLQMSPAVELLGEKSEKSTS
jgi:small-conductance mechanosensitive channel